MAKSFIDVVQDSPRTRIGIPVKTKDPFFRTNTPPAGPPVCSEVHERLVAAYSRVRLFRPPPQSAPSPIRLNRPAAPARGVKGSLP